MTRCVTAWWAATIPSLFAIGETSGELYYVGAGEDYESGVTSHELTVRASDGTHTIDTTVTVTITDAADAPAFAEESYAFVAGGERGRERQRLSLGAVTATDPDSDTVRYSLLVGNDSSLFAIGRRAVSCTTSARVRTLRVESPRTS